jgi:hypothetical protein
MIHLIESDILSLADKHVLANLLARHASRQASLLEEQLQAELRWQIDSQPNPTPQSVKDRAEQDRTTVYVPGIRGGRRVITLGVAPAPPPVVEAPPEVKLDTVPEPVLAPEPKPTEPFVAAPPESFLSRVWKWLKSFPI